MVFTRHESLSWPFCEMIYLERFFGLKVGITSDKGNRRIDNAYPTRYGILKCLNMRIYIYILGLSLYVLVLKMGGFWEDICSTILVRTRDLLR